VDVSRSDYALLRRAAADEVRMSGRPIGALHGVPVGLKDIIDTADMPTENGSVLHAGRTPVRATRRVVSLLRAAGRGHPRKTVTTEFATRTPGRTRNPHNSGHTPGGSSSGSPRRWRAGMVRWRSAARPPGRRSVRRRTAGVYGLKPTHGLVPRHEHVPISRTLDHVGLFARSVRGRRLLLEELASHDERDPDSRPAARVPYRVSVARRGAPADAQFAFREDLALGACRPPTPATPSMSSPSASAIASRSLELVTPSDEVLEWQRAVGAPNRRSICAASGSTGATASPALRARIEQGREGPRGRLSARARAFPSSTRA